MSLPNNLTAKKIKHEMIAPPNAPPIAESPSPRHNDPRLKESPNAYRINVDPFFPPIGGLSYGLDPRDSMNQMSPHDKLLPIEEKLASWHPLLQNIVIKAARSMIRLSCSLQDKQKVLSKYDAAFLNGDLFIPRSAAFKTTLSVQKDFCKDPEITAIDMKIAAATKRSSVAVSGYIRDSLKRVITLMTQEKVKQVAFHLIELTKHISNCVFENSLTNLPWTEVSRTRRPLYCVLPFIDDLANNTPGFFSTYLSCRADEFRLEATKLFFFK
jgi:RNase P/RNase MRP subunit p29